MTHPTFPMGYISKLICLAGLIATVLGVQGFAQVAPTGTISGLVSDASGASIVNAQVKVTNADTNVTQTAATGSNGGYRFSALPIGRYDVTVTMAGFKTETEKSVILDVGQEAIENFKLAIGAPSQQVIVTAEGAQVDTTSSSLGSLVDSGQIADLPLNGRNFIDLTVLQTGITQFSNNIFGAFGLFGELFSSNGAPLRSNMYTLDGAIMGNIVAASASSLDGESLGLDGIAQYKTMTNSYEAEYGLVMGSQTTIVTKSGKNQFHGDAFEYLRNNVLDARSYFDELYTLPTTTPGGGDRIAPFRRNQFGGALGGPIKRDKLFFFATYEGFRELSDNPPTVGITPTIPAACHTPVVGGVETVTNACDSTLQPGQTENVDPVMQPILAQWPIPNIQPGNEFGYLSTNTIHEDYVQGRIDDTMSDKDSIFGRYTYDNTNELYPTVYPQFNDGLVERQQYFTLAERHIVSARLVNSGSFSYSRSRVFDSTPASLNPATALIGPQYSCISGSAICAIALPNFTDFGFTDEAVANVQGIFTVGDDAFWTKGKHEIKSGVLFNHYNQYGNQGEGPSGELNFPSIHGFLLGDYESYKTFTAQGYNSLKDMLFGTFGSYIEDRYHVRPRLVVNLGLRYEFATQPNEKNGRQSYFVDPPYSDTVSLGPIVDNPTHRDVSPRVGFAWDIFGNGKTSLKGGSAILYDIANFGAVFALAGEATPPYALSFVETPTTGGPTTLELPLPIPASTGTLQGTAPTTINRNYKSPHMVDYNLAIERQLPGELTLSVAFAGSRGLNLWQPVSEANPDCPTSYKVVLQGCAGVTTGTSNLPVWANATAPRLNPFFSNFSVFGTAGVSWYNALEVNLTKKLSHGVQFQAAYTYSKLLDDTEGVANSDTSGSTTSQVEDPLDPILDYGPANFDVRQNLHFNVLYHLPDFVSRQSFTGKFVNGWWTGSIVSVQTGMPFSPLLASDREQAGLAGTNGGLERPSYVTAANVATIAAEAQAAGLTTCPANSSGCIPYNPVVYNAKTVITHSVQQWFNPNMFALQPVGTIGDVGRNTLTEPGLATWDFSLNKDTALGMLGESGKLQFRAEFFNLLNHTNFGPAQNGGFLAGSVGDIVEQPSFTGLINTNTPSREIQFSLKAIF